MCNRSCTCYLVGFVSQDTQHSKRTICLSSFTLTGGQSQLKWMAPANSLFPVNGSRPPSRSAIIFPLAGCGGVVPV